jgi:transcriptional regulator with XRE-family HTH domain
MRSSRAEAVTNIPRLRELREFHGVTRRTLAEVLDVADRTILRWEAGEQDPNLSDLRKIAAHFGVSVAYLVGEASK